MSTVGQHDETNRLLSAIPVDRTSVTSIGANESLFATGLVPSRAVGQFRVQANFAQAGRISVIVATSTASWAMGVLTETGTLVANEGYTFQFSTRGDRTYNFTYTAAGSVNELVVDEIP